MHEYERVCIDVLTTYLGHPRWIYGVRNVEVGVGLIRAL